MMNAQKADSILDSCSEVFQSFCLAHGLRIKRNDHFEGINRVFEWTEGATLKAVVIEFTYSDKPSFDISMKAFNRIGLWLHRYGGVLGRLFPLRQWYNRLAQVELPQDKGRLAGLLEDAYRELAAIEVGSSRYTSDNTHININDL